MKNFFLISPFLLLVVCLAGPTVSQAADCNLAYSCLCRKPAPQDRCKQIDVTPIQRGCATAPTPSLGSCANTCNANAPFTQVVQLVSQAGLAIDYTNIPLCFNQAPTPTPTPVVAATPTPAIVQAAADKAAADKVEADKAATLKAEADKAAADKAKADAARESGSLATKSKFLPDCVLADKLETDPATGAVLGPCGDVSIYIILLLNISSYLFTIVGALALAVFVYGGFMLILSEGNPERVKAGTDALLAAVIGLAIVFGAYLLIRFLGQALNIKEQFRLF